MRMKRNVVSIVDHGLCVGCGVCQDACGYKCITIKHDKDINIPQVNNELCIECGLCLKICVGKGIQIGKLSKELFKTDNSFYDKYAGYIHSCFAGYSTNYDIRYHSASGGCLSHFLIYLLEKKIIDGAVVVNFQKTKPMAPNVFIAHTKEEILSSQSSKYCVVSYGGIIKDLLARNGKFIVVGLPCHIEAFRKYAMIFKKLKDVVIGYFSIYCSSNRTMRSQDYLLYRYNINPSEIKKFAYRDNGCLGNMCFYNKNDEIIKSIPYQHFWMGMKGFFNVPRCSLCIDHYGELADVCFGDIHVGDYKKDNIGINSLCSRSSYWTTQLKHAMEDGYLFLEEISIKTLNSSQGYIMRQKKGRGVAAAYRLRTLLGMNNPQYDIPFIAEPNIIDLFKDAAKYLMRFIGRHRTFWFIIKFLDRNK